MKQRLLYVMDPLCGWSYGASDDFLALYHHYQDHYDFELLVGGIKIGRQVTPGGEEMGAYVHRASRFITELSGKKFSDAYFKNLALNPGYLFDSTPPSKAIVAVRFIDHQLAIPYANRLQRASFVDGRNISDEKVLTSLATELEIDEQGFLALYRSELVSQTTWEDYRRARQMEVDSFPSLYLVHGANRTLISKGYLSLEQLKQRLAFCYVPLEH